MTRTDVVMAFLAANHRAKVLADPAPPMIVVSRYMRDMKTQPQFVRIVLITRSRVASHPSVTYEFMATKGPTAIVHDCYAYTPGRRLLPDQPIPGNAMDIALSMARNVASVHDWQAFARRATEPLG